MANVIFKVGTLEQYKNLAEYSSTTLYWLEDVQQLYKGDKLYGVGTEATAMVSGLMSAADKVKLDSIDIGAFASLIPVDGSLIIGTDESGDRTIRVALSAEAGNILSVRDDGLFATVESVVAPEFAIERQDLAEDGFAATYKLKRTLGEDVSYVGDAINIPKDLVLQSGSLNVVTVADEPYEGAEIGDPYLDLVLNSAESSHIYVPVKGLVSPVEVDPDNAHGLVAVDGKIGIDLATAETAGAMSAEDKAFVDSIRETYAVPNAEQFVVSDGVFSLDNLDADNVTFDDTSLSELLEEIKKAYSWTDMSETVVAEPAVAVESIASAAEGATVKVSEGTIDTPVSVAKSVVVEGVNAGIAQDFDQEV